MLPSGAIALLVSALYALVFPSSAKKNDLPTRLHALLPSFLPIDPFPNDVCPSEETSEI